MSSQIVRSTFKEIADEIRLSLGNRTDQNPLIRSKINAAAQAIGTMTPHKQLLSTYTQALTASTAEYSVPATVFSILSVKNITDGEEGQLKRRHFFRLDDLDDVSPTTGRPTEYAVYGGSLYIFNQIPDGTSRTLRARTWLLHPIIEQDNDRHQLDETWDEALKALATSMVFMVLNRREEAQVKRQEFNGYLSILLTRVAAQDIYDQTSTVIYGR